MCGISGFFSKQAASVGLVEAMNNKIKHRGPDDEGYFALFNKNFWVSAGNDTPQFEPDEACKYLPRTKLDLALDANLALGHRRLSIMDLSVLGHQPMCDPTQRYWIIFNGEVYNYKEIRSILEANNFTFRSDSDTEVVLAALAFWGESALDKFVGMWAIVLFDRELNKLTLIRDRFGIKPLYYWISRSGILHFASEIKQFSASPEWDARLNIARALDYLTVNGLTDHTEETLFRDVFQVQPGCLVDLPLDDIQLVAGVQLSNRRWYNPTTTPFTGSPDSAKEQFLALFKRSIALHLTSDVNVGFALSGGLDSSSILCTAQDLHRSNAAENNHVTFSAVSEEKEFSEHEWIEKVHQHLKNVEAHFVSPKPNDMFKHFEDLIWHLDEPHQSQSAFFGYKIFECAKSSNIKVLLNGQGADEYLSCYGAYRHMFFKSIGFTELVNTQLNLGKNYLDSVLFALKNRFYDIYFSSSGYVRAALFAMKASTRRMKLYLADDIYSKHFNYPFTDVGFKDKNLVSSFQIYKDALPRYLRWEDRNSMAHSVEARVPFLDHRLVEFCHNLSLSHLDDGVTSKKLLVDVMYGILPEDVRNRKDKKGFITPEQQWFMTTYTDRLRDMLKHAIEYSNGFFSSKCIEDFDKMIAGKIQFDLCFWRIIVLGYWMKVHRVKFK